jgi:hypothetical protein
MGTSRALDRCQNSWLREAYVDARRVIEAAFLGAAAGLAASWMMSQFDGAWKAASSENQDGDEPNTVKAADAVAEGTVGQRIADSYRGPAGTAVHYGFGALLGAIYGLLFRRRISNQPIKLLPGLCGVEVASIDLLLNHCFDLDDLFFRRIAVWLFRHRTSRKLFDR